MLTGCWLSIDSSIQFGLWQSLLHPPTCCSVLIWSGPRVASWSQHVKALMSLPIKLQGNTLRWCSSFFTVAHSRVFLWYQALESAAIGSSKGIFMDRSASSDILPQAIRNSQLSCSMAIGLGAGMSPTSLSASACKLDCFTQVHVNNG